MLKINYQEIPIIKFPVGEQGVNVLPFNGSTGYEIYLRYESDQDLINLLMTVDALRRVKPNAWLQLVIPYIPYGRQDRVVNKGEALGIKVVADLINSCKFDQVRTVNPHSDVTTALINNLIVIDERYNLADIIRRNNITHLVSPDAGALKKVYQLAKVFNLPVIECSKKRDVATGNLQGCKIHDTITNIANYMVVDDICDGGGTFILLAQEFFKKFTSTKPNMYLYVSHGFFTKGKEELSKYYKGIFNYEY